MSLDSSKAVTQKNTSRDMFEVAGLRKPTDRRDILKMKLLALKS